MKPAEHMAAPTNAANVKKVLANSGAVHTWHFCEVLTGTEIVCLPG
jgi:hypothetical protein